MTDLTGAADVVKIEARRAAFQRRKEAFAAGQGRAAEHLAVALLPHAGRVLAGYMPMRTEINPLTAMAAHDGPVCVPVIVGRGMPLRFRRWTPDCAMVTGEFGAMIPEGGDWLEPDVLIVPLLAWDRRGYRLGYGGGYYDRTLERLRGSGPRVGIGFAFAAQEVGQVPIDRFDQVLDHLVTENGVEF